MTKNLSNGGVTKDKLNNEHIKEQFDLLNNSLIDIRKNFVEHVSRMATLLLVVLGWIATSDSARKHLSTHATNKSAAIFIIISVFVLTAVLSYLSYINQKKFSLI
jgi:predicted tellurium resistance membrane protein TerC